MKEETPKELLYVSRIRKGLIDNKIMLTYKGEISQDIMLGLLELTEKKLDANHTDMSVKSKIFNVMVGCLQNIIYHSEKDSLSKSSMFMICYVDKGYAIYSGNAVKKDKVGIFRSKLMTINNMSVQELTDFYKSWITTRELSNKNSVGLGLIDIARKTGNGLEFDFEPLNDQYSYFSLKTMVKLT
ncbi:MAG: SiaB family protein kinase [Bacteroidota bacterium]